MKVWWLRLLFLLCYTSHAARKADSPGSNGIKQEAARRPLNLHDRSTSLHMTQKVPHENFFQAEIHMT